MSEKLSHDVDIGNRKNRNWNVNMKEGMCLVRRWAPDEQNYNMLDDAVDLIIELI